MRVDLGEGRRVAGVEGGAPGLHQPAVVADPDVKGREGGGQPDPHGLPGQPRGPENGDPLGRHEGEDLFEMVAGQRLQGEPRREPIREPGRFGDHLPETLNVSWEEPGNVGADPMAYLASMVAIMRTTREQWIEQGLAALASGGPDSVRVEALAAALGVSKGGFYGQFADRAALLDAMLDTWDGRARRTCGAGGGAGGDAGASCVRPAL